MHDQFYENFYENLDNNLSTLKESYLVNTYYNYLKHQIQNHPMVAR